jgi:hypothetical protein
MEPAVPWIQKKKQKKKNRQYHGTFHAPNTTNVTWPPFLLNKNLDVPLVIGRYRIFTNGAFFMNKNIKLIKYKK